MARTTPHEPPPAEGEPLYRRIATELLGELRDGTIPPGERLPSERRLAGHLGVSRETVRQSLELLRRDGLVTTDRRGSHAQQLLDHRDATRWAGEGQLRNAHHQQCRRRDLEICHRHRQLLVGGTPQTTSS